jgi:hypothetical protein
MSPHDECEHWRLSSTGMSGRKLSSEEQRRAEEIWQAFQPVSERLRTLDCLPAAEVAELIEQVAPAANSPMRMLL